jgi:hypothetical protein
MAANLPGVYETFHTEVIMTTTTTTEVLSPDIQTPLDTLAILKLSVQRLPPEIKDDVVRKQHALLSHITNGLDDLGPAELLLVMAHLHGLLVLDFLMRGDHLSKLN